MKPRTLLAPLGVAAVLAGSIVPATGATAAPSHSTKPGFSSTAPKFVTVNGEPAAGDLFDADDAPARIQITGGVQPGGIVTVTDVDTGATVCEAPNIAPAGDTAEFLCTTTTTLPYGETHLTATVRSSDGQLVSDTSKPAGIVHQYRGSVMVVDSYDDATKTAHVSGTSLPGERFVVAAGWMGSLKTTGTVRSDGSWSASLEGYERESTLYFTLPDVQWSVAASAIVHKPGFAPTPSVCGCTTVNSIATVTFNTEPGLINVYDQDDRKVAASVVAPGKYKGVVTLPVPRGERTYTAELVQGDAVSSRVSFTLLESEPAAPVEAPSVSRAVIQGASVLTAVSGDIGGVVRVTDESGRAVAVGVVGASGSRQLRFAMPTDRADLPVYTVTQVVDGVTSPATRFTPVAG